MARFKTKARSVDLLGKQQIRDEVTAIYELLRNSYDADADEGLVDVDTRKGRIVVLDDGEGMTETDIENNWLTLGTYSKYDRSKLKTRKGRIKVGEKGIGRLAISLLGDQLLLVSKKEDVGTWSLLYLHWDLFREERVFLEDIHIPTKSFDNLEQLTTFLFDGFDQLKNSLLSNVQTEGARWKEENVKKLRDQVKEFQITNDLINTIRWIESKGKGTLFYITHLDRSIDWRIFNLQTDDDSIRKRKQRLKDIIFSFQNIIELLDRREGTKENEFQPRIHIDGTRLEDESGWNQGDLELFDYALKGTIQKGRFSGEALIRTLNGVQTYSINDILLTQGMNISDTQDCGPIDIKWFFVEGTKSLTSLPNDKHETITRKLDEMGGIFVFRDGVRILPYGEPGNDFLEMEERRSRSASYYLFSHRRMYGYMEISKEKNPLLMDKSSREGFVENAAYNYFRQVGINLLIWWARDFLESAKDEGLRQSRNEQLKKEREREQSALQKQKMEEAREKEYFRLLGKRIATFNKDLKEVSQTTRDFIDKRFQDIQVEINTSRGIISSPDHQLYNLSNELYQAISRFDELRIEPNPRYFHDSETMNEIAVCNDLLENEKLEITELVENKMKAIKEQSSLLLLEMSKYGFDQIVHRIRTAIQWNLELPTLFDKILDNKVGQLNQDVEQFVKLLVETVKNDLKNSSDYYDFIKLEMQKNLRKLQSLLSRFESLEHLRSPQLLYEESEKAILEFEEFREKTYAMLIRFESSEEHSKIYKSIRKKLTEWRKIIEDRKFDNDDELIGLLKKEVDLYRDLSAVGLAAELTSHEFNGLYAGINENIKILQGALKTTRVIPYIEKIKRAFNSLERLHQRMSPLYRQSRFRRTEIVLRDFINDVVEYFRSDIERYGIKIINDVPHSFTIRETDAVLFTPLINLLSNSIYWLLDREIKEIHYYVFDSSLYVHDSGPGIPNKDRARIFEPFFTKRVSGRGLGLFLSRDILESRGHLLDLVESGNEPRTIPGACFSIKFNPNALANMEG